MTRLIILISLTIALPCLASDRFDSIARSFLTYIAQEKFERAAGMVDYRERYTFDAQHLEALFPETFDAADCKAIAAINNLKVSAKITHAYYSYLCNFTSVHITMDVKTKKILNVTADTDLISGASEMY
ncbi:hypothetical protein [Simiduia agarivorans]|nr:hypothetical protein [Simiduia agarivorans]